MTPTDAQRRAAKQALSEGLCIQCDDAVEMCPICARCRICEHQDWCERHPHMEYR